jgi:acyl-coenzyme A thioesterase 13
LIILSEASMMSGEDTPNSGLHENPPVPGFAPLRRSSPFLERVGPLYQRVIDGPFTVGLRVLPEHVNGRGLVHGGLLSTLADVALGYATAFSQEPALPLVTVNLSMDFCGSAGLGEWVEVQPSVHKVGRNMAFASAMLTVDGRPLARASAVFQVAHR